MVKYIVILIASLVMYFQAPQTMDKTYMSVALLIAIICFVMFCRDGNTKYNKLNKVYLRHSILFIACFIIVYYQCNIDYVLGLTDDTDYYIYDYRVVCKGLALSNIALSSLILGYHLYKTKERSFPRQIFDDRSSYIYNNKIVVFLVILFLGIYVIFTPTEYFNNGYGTGLSGGPVSAIMGYLVSFFIAMFIIYGTRSLRTTSWGKKFRIPLILSIIYIVLVIITGRRTESIRVGFIVLFFYLFFNKAVNYKKIILYGLLVMVVFSISGVLRSLQGGDIVTSYEMIKNYSSILPFTKELATSVNTLHIALSHYPTEYSFNMGATFFPGFFKIIPGLSSVGTFIFGESFLEGSDAVFTKIYFGGSDISYGLGSSIVADVYISFGLMGVLLVFMALGYFFRYLEVGTFCENKSVYFMALSVSVYSQLMFACRGTIPILFLCWAYSCILLFLVKRKTFKYNHQNI